MASAPRPSTLYHTDLQSAQDELAEIAASVTRIQSKLTDIIRKSRDEAQIVGEQMAALESDCYDLRHELDRVWAENEEIQLREQAAIAKNNPETQKAIEARNAALKKLHRTRKVVYDLLVERRFGINMSGDGLSALGEDGSLPVVSRQTETLALSHDLSPGGSTSIGDDDTVRPRRNAQKDNLKQDLVAARAAASPTSGALNGLKPPGQRGEPPVRSPAQRAGSGSVDSGQAPYAIRYTAIPLSSGVKTPAISWVELSQRLGLDDVKVTELKSLAHAQGPGMRLQTWDDVIFVYDPIILEGGREPGKTYLIDWAEKKRNNGAKQYIRRALQKSSISILHTFIFQVKKDAWFYFGAMSWEPTELKWSVWPTLRARSRAVLAGKLCDRCGSSLDEKEVLEKLDGEQLQQFCVQIEGRTSPQVAASRAFATKIGYPDLGPSVYDQSE